MTTIFISGSREIPFVPDEARERIDRIIDSKFEVVVGDSERGVDSAILRYLESRAYENVTIYTIHDSPRVKHVLNSWRVHLVKPDMETKTDETGNVRNRRELETAKDQAMGNKADFGLVVWQSTYTNRFGKTAVSKGSLRNMHQLLSASRPVVLYAANEDDVDGTGFTCYELRTLDDLRRVINSKSDIVAREYAKIEKRTKCSHLSLFQESTV